MASSYYEFVENLNGVWSAMNNWSGTIKSPKVVPNVDILFTLNLLYVDGNPAWYFCKSLKHLKIPNNVNVQFSGYISRYPNGEISTFHTTMVWIGKKPSIQVHEKASLLKGNMNEVQHLIMSIREPVDVSKTKGILRFVGNSVVALSMYNQKFFAVCSHLLPFLKKANLKNGDYIQFTAFGEFASLQGDEFFANYSWIVRTIERYTNETSQPKNRNGLLPVPKPMAMAKKSASVENLSKFQNSNLNGKPPVQPLMAGVPFGHFKIIDEPKKKSANKKRDRKKKVKTAAAAGDCSKDNSSDSDSDTGSCYSSVSSTAHSETDLIKRLDLLKMEMPSTSEKNHIEPVEITSRKDKVGVVKPVISEIKQKNRVQKVETKTYKAAPMKIFKEVSVQTISSGELICGDCNSSLY